MTRGVAHHQFALAGTPIAAAAASISAIRPAAPARLIASKFIIVLQLPPVICAPSTGSLNFGSLEASWTRMSFQLAPSSSATICAMVRGDVLAHVGLAAGDGDEAVGRDRVPDAGLEIGGAASA